VSSTITDASAPAGIGAPVMMRIASPAPTALGRPTRSNLGDHSQARRCGHDIRRPHRVAVDRRVGERRNVLVRHDGVGEHAPDGVGDRGFDDIGNSAAFEHVGAGLEFADHGSNGTVSSVSSYTALPASGRTVRWAAWEGDDVEVTDLRWENEGWTVSGQVSRERVQYVVRLSATWQVRQFLLFRDLDDPDLWLATDGTARWGEMNGAHRAELDGATTSIWRARPSRTRCRSAGYLYWSVTVRTCGS
jgi:hypothetical protein